MKSKKIILLVMVLTAISSFFLPKTSIVAETMQKDKWCWCVDFVKNYFKLPKTSDAYKMGTILLENKFKKLKSYEIPKSGDVVIMHPNVFKNSTGPESKAGHIAVILSIKEDSTKKKWVMTTLQAGPTTSWGDKPFALNGCSNVQRNVRWAAFLKTNSNYSFYRKK